MKCRETVNNSVVTCPCFSVHKATYHEVAFQCSADSLNGRYTLWRVLVHARDKDVVYAAEFAPVDALETCPRKLRDIVAPRFRQAVDSG